MARLRPRFPWNRLSPYGVSLNDSSVDSTILLDCAVSGAGLQDSSVDSNKLADSVVSTQTIQDSAVDSSKLADSAVSTDGLQDCAVTSIKIGDSQVTANEIADCTITSVKIADSTIVAGDIADSAITSAKISDSAIVSADINDCGVLTADINNRAITLAKMDSGTTGNLITYDSSGGAAAAVSTGTSGQVLTSNGAGNVPTFQAASSSLAVVPFSCVFEASGRAVTNTVVGSGFNTFGTSGLVQGTGTTNPSSCNVNINVGSNATNTYLYNAGGSFSCLLRIDTLGATASSFYGIGAVTVAGSGHTYTDAHIGFKILTAASVMSLYGTVSGGTETATSALTTFSANDTVWLRVDIVSTSSVNFYFRKTNGSWSSATNVTTNIPTSTTNILQCSLANDNTAANTRIDVAYIAYQQ